MNYKNNKLNYELLTIYYLNPILIYSIIKSKPKTLESDIRYIEVYTAFNTKDKKTIKYNLSSIITLNNAEEYGAFVLSRINDKDRRRKNKIPLLDILILSSSEV